jgi:hypothetical protein
LNFLARLDLTLPPLQVREIIKYLEDNYVVLPNGGQLTVSRWQQLGINFGMQGNVTSPSFL